ncbi:hypothetical protein D3C80_1031760 [compost metagenome]
MQGHDVGLGVAGAFGVQARLHGDGRQGADAVAHPGGVLELHVVGSRLHLGGQAGDDGPRLAAQEGLGLVHQLAVVLQADQAGAGRRAALDLMQHAGPGAGLVDAVRAGPQQEGLLQGVQRVVDRPGRGEGAEIGARRRVGAAMLPHLGRAVVAPDHDLGEGLVVLEQDVEAGLQPLDVAGLEDQGLGLGGGDHQLHRPGQRHHQADALGVEAALRVLDDALLQRLGLADIEAGAVLAVHAIDAGLVGGAARLVGDQGGGLQGQGSIGRGVGRRVALGVDRLVGHRGGYRLSRAGPEARRRKPALRPAAGSGSAAAWARRARRSGPAGR